MTIKIKEENEKIIGIGTKDIMNSAYQKKLNYNKFLNTDFMKNKICKEFFTKDINVSKFIVYNISEKK